MKLTIKNFENICYHSITNDNWYVLRVEETPTEYRFHCVNNLKPEFNGETRIIRLNRNPVSVMNPNFHAYPFQRKTGESQVTAAWFADMDNAMQSLGNELNYAEIIKQ